MSALPIVIAVLSAWAVLATIFSLIQGRALQRERDGHEEAQDTIARYRTALAQLKDKADATAGQYETLHRAYTALKQVLDERDEREEREGGAGAGRAAQGNAPSLPTVMIDSLDISSEIGTLFEHVARVARAIRNYGAFTRGHSAPESSKARYDLHWLSDCLHSFDEIGRALARGNVDALNTACTGLLSMYDAYLKDGSGYNSRDTFLRLAADVPLTDVSNAVRAISMKTAPAGTAVAEADPLI